MENKNIEEKTNTGNIEKHNNILDVQVNNKILKDFLNPVNKKDDYRLAVDNDSISYEHKDKWLINKTILLNSGCERYNVDNPILLDIPLKKFKEFLRTAKKDDTIHICYNYNDNLLVFAHNHLCFKYQSANLHNIGDLEQKNTIESDLEHKDITPEDKFKECQDSIPYVLRGKEYSEVKYWKDRDNMYNVEYKGEIKTYKSHIESIRYLNKLCCGHKSIGIMLKEGV